MSVSTVHFLIKVLPGLLVLISLDISVIVGVLRGFRKSLILLIQSLALFTIFLITFLIFTSSNKADPRTFSLISSFIGKGTIQNMMGVSLDCSSFTDCFIEWIPKQMNYTDALELILRENGQYLLTLSSQAAKVIVAIVFYLFYLILEFLCYILYLIFYPERRHRKRMFNKTLLSMNGPIIDSYFYNKKKEESKEENISEETIHDEEEPLSEASMETPEAEAFKKENFVSPVYIYKKRRMLGGLIGGLRSVVASIIFLSFLGSFFYIAAGGTGKEEMEEMDWTDDDINLVYDCYSEIESYGTEGIFKILNVTHNKNQVPYYLFAADLVFKGHLSIPEEDISVNVYFRKEASSYTKFAKDTLNLLLKYGKDDIKSCLNSEDSKSILDTVVGIMAEDEFKEEFNLLIDNFESSTYFINLSYSLVSSIINHMDELGLNDKLGSDNISLMQLLFKKGYYAEQIPYEKYLKDTGSDEVLPYLSPSVILNKNDAKVLLNMVIDALAVNSEEMDETEKAILLAKTVVPYLDDFTLLQTESSSDVDPVLSRLYQFIVSVYMSDATAEETTLTALTYGDVTNPYSSEKYEEISWVEEIRKLVDSVIDILNLAWNVYDPNIPVSDMIFNVFNTSLPLYSSNKAYFQDLKDNISGSFLLGDILASEWGSTILLNVFRTIMPGLELPDISYSDYKDSSGNTVHGEFYYAISAIEAFCYNQDNLKLIHEFTNAGENTDMIVLLAWLSNSLTTFTYQGRSVMDNVTSSLLFRTLLSEILISTDSGDELPIYVDDSILVDGMYHQIDKSEFDTFFMKINVLIQSVKDIDTSDFDALADKIFTYEIYNTLDSKIIEGTLSKLVIMATEDDEEIIIPNSLKEGEGMVSKKGEDSEIKKLLGLFDVEGFEIDVITEDYDTDDSEADSYLSMFRLMNEARIKRMLKSDIMYYSVSNYITKNRENRLGAGADLIIPVCVRQENDTLDILIEKEELKNLLLEFTTIFPDTVTGTNGSTILNSILDNIEYVTCDIILSASIANMLANGSELSHTLSSILTIPDSLKSAIDDEDDLLFYTKDNPWYKEEKAFFLGLKAFLGDYIGNNSLDDGNAFNTALMSSVTTLNNPYEDGTVLDYVYESLILKSTLTQKIDDSEILYPDMAETIKDDTGIYEKKEVSSLVNLFVILDLDFSNPDLSDIIGRKDVLNTLLKTSDNGSTNLHNQYQDGKITGLVLTKVILDSGMEIPPDSYQEGEKYIKECEAESLLRFMDETENGMEDADFGILSVSEMEALMFQNTTVISYILLKQVSDEIKNTDSIFIPVESYDIGFERIKDKDMKEFLDAVSALMGKDTKISLMSSFKNTVIPKNADTLKIVSESLIMDLSITKNINISYNGLKKEIQIENDSKYVSLTRDINGNSVSLASKTEICNLLYGASLLAEGRSINEIELTSENILGMEDDVREKAFQSSILRILLSDIYMDFGIVIPPGTEIDSLDVLNMDTLLITKEYKVFSYSELSSLQS